MKRVVLACATVGFLAAHSAPVSAQVTIDVTKITCDQWLTYKVADFDHIAIWISGYLNGKRSNTTIDIQASKEAVRRVKAACFKSMQAPLMQALEQELGPFR